ncbi:hypothetical protein MRX96_042816 [Rhipicephalus microplus]
MTVFEIPNPCEIPATVGESRFGSRRGRTGECRRNGRSAWSRDRAPSPRYGFPEGCHRCPYNRKPLEEEEQASAREEDCSSLAEYSGFPTLRWEPVHAYHYVTTPLHSVLPPGHLAPPTSETVDNEGFQTVRSKAALRRTRNLASAALPVDPTVMGTVLYQPASAGGSFRNCSTLTIAQALSLRTGVAAIRVN